MRSPTRPILLSQFTRRLVVILPLLLACATPALAVEPDYSGLQDLLRQYVRVLPVAKGQPWDSRFDYEQLFLDEGVWRTRRSDRLATLHNMLLAARISELTANERLAWAINTHNLLVIERMTMNLLVPGRRFQRHTSPRQVQDGVGSFFGGPVARVDDRTYSIAGFALRFVYGDTTADPVADISIARETPGDPRLSLALHHAALCSGPVLPWVYRADSLEAQLDRATRRAVALPRYLRAEPKEGLLYASNRFFEQRADFGGPQLPGLLPFVSRYLPAATRRLLESRKLTRPSHFFEPDWKLDQFDHPAPKLPGAEGVK